MEEHLQSHDQIPAGPTATMTAGQNGEGSVEVVPVSSKAGVVTWEASEHIDYANGKGWTALMVLGGLALATGMYFIANIFSAFVVILLLAGLLFYSKLKPRTVRYTVSNEGVSVGDKIYNYEDFRSFSYNFEDGIGSIFLVPVQRFMMPVTMYVSPDTESKIADVLAQHLPNEQRTPDLMDKLAAKLRL